ncbi:hypothetical protein [Chryseobacterium sp.]|uniref:hypothetical protein n=1 Tax=Chryseobacterium sp. TaxID=1871047 RepID=UPI0025BC3826|nr:hypothetical protein [Chryseobacterium sp.]MBV8327696.1 hypothetical protein [Chryseobacterium sp.]
MEFLKQNYWIPLLLLIAGVFYYDSSLKKKFEAEYKQNGVYAVGKIREIKPYGKGGGYHYVYSFEVNNWRYQGLCDAGKLPSSKVYENKNKRFLVLYLKNNISNSRLYTAVPVDDHIKDNSELQKWVADNPSVKAEFDSIPDPGLFIENYF